MSGIIEQWTNGTGQDGDEQAPVTGGDEQTPTTGDDEQAPVTGGGDEQASTTDNDVDRENVDNADVVVDDIKTDTPLDTGINMTDINANVISVALSKNHDQATEQSTNAVAENNQDLVLPATGITNEAENNNLLVVLSLVMASLIGGLGLAKIKQHHN
ncbi:hypothetical protein [Weissella hellenica]|uniref:Gram-positive cocci surface proteins LPxTG domain-containing protein n=1 Tax=Weissella hellenica TaxID=46256 RepID=A0ABY0K2N0_WEIHE|nr:hypothetical protein [Weissella hellenica]GED36441.1 hypothetical protein WHE01_13450 [Weissella hellenica]SCC07825.1 hypothetical protein GA0061075_11446 [Weissella hellenica]